VELPFTSPPESLSKPFQLMLEGPFYFGKFLFFPKFLGLGPRFIQEGLGQHFSECLYSNSAVIFYLTPSSQIWYFGANFSVKQPQILFPHSRDLNFFLFQSLNFYFWDGTGKLGGFRSILEFSPEGGFPTWLISLGCLALSKAFLGNKGVPFSPLSYGVWGNLWVSPRVGLPGYSFSSHSVSQVFGVSPILRASIPGRFFSLFYLGPYSWGSPEFCTRVSKRCFLYSPTVNYFGGVPPPGGQ